MSDTNVAESTDVRTTPTVDSPPPAAQPARAEPDPRARLHEMARELIRTRNRRVLIEYLRLRRAIV
jgi:hypothetical protein